MNFSIDDLKAHLDQLAKDLLDALDGNDREKALAAQQAFSSAITVLWGAMEENNIDPKAKAIFRLVADWAMNELPRQIQDPANNSEIKHQINVFRRSLVVFSYSDYH
jgi:hypothetical protein